MVRQLLTPVRRHPWKALVVALLSVGLGLLVISWPRPLKNYAANRLLWVVISDEEETDPLGSKLIFPALDEVARFEAEDEAVAVLVPLLDPKDYRTWLRALVCLHHLKRLSPGSIAALTAVYRDKAAPAMARIDSAVLLSKLAPESARRCGADETARRLARTPDLVRGDAADLLDDKADVGDR